MTELLIVAATVVFTLGIIVTVHSFGEAGTQWDDVHERRNGDQ